MIRRIAAGLVGTAAFISMAAGYAAPAITVHADQDVYACDFTVGGSAYIEQEIENKYGEEAIALYHEVVGKIADYAYNGTDIEDTMNISVSSSHSMGTDVASAVFGYVFKNNPQFYWLGNQWSYSYRSKSTIIYYDFNIAVIDDYKNGETRRETSAQVAQQLYEYHELVESKNTTLEKIMAVNDKIDADTEYISVDAISHRSTGCLLRHQCVCEGYSKAFQLICNREGLGDNIFVEGIGNNGSDSEAHGWNIIQFDGAWYYVDPTWNDIILYDCNGNLVDNSSRWHDYFMRGSGYMQANHQVGDHIYASSNNQAHYLDYPVASMVDLKAYLYADSMTLGESMEYTIYCDTLDDDTYASADFSMTVTIDGEEKNLAGVRKNVNGNDLVAFTMEIPAKNIADSIDGEILVEDTTEDFTANYSFCAKDYLVKLYNSTPDESERKLAAAALNYAAAAQQYKDYNTSDLASGYIDAEDRELPQLTPDMFNGGYQLSDEDNGVKIRSASLDMLSRTRIRVYFTLDEGYASAYSDGTGRAEVKMTAADGSVQTVTVNSAYEALGRCGRDGDLYWVESSGISPLRYADAVIFEVKGEGDTAADTLSYSVYDYFRSKCAADTGIENVVAAMFAYGEAADNYVATRK